MNNHRITSLPPGLYLEGCTVARSSASGGHVFVKTPAGRVFTASRMYQEVDLLADFGSTAKDRSVYAKLAGITAKELEAARKVARGKEGEERRVFALRRLKSDAAKLGMKVIKA